MGAGAAMFAGVTVIGAGLALGNVLVIFAGAVALLWGVNRAKDEAFEEDRRRELRRGTFDPGDDEDLP